MTEKLRTGIEQNLDLEDARKEAENRIETFRQEALEATNSTEHDVATLQEQASEAARSTDLYKIEGPKPDNTAAHFSMHRINKEEAYSRTMQRVQSSLSGPERALSKIAHQPQVESVSNAASKTIARPAGILGSGITALIGSALLLYMSTHYGFSYNYTSFIALIVIGYFLGLLVELFIRIFKK